MTLTSDHMPQVNLVAAVGRGGTIGPRDGLPRFKNPEEGNHFRDWFLELSRGGVLVVGGRTLDMMLAANYAGPGHDHTLAVWSKRRIGHGDPDAFMEHVMSLGRPIFIIGGEATYQTFMPYVKQFFLRRTELLGPAECHLPPIFGRVN